MKDATKEAMQYLCVAVTLVILSLIPWFLDQWWKLLIAAFFSTMSAAAISVEREKEDTTRHTRN